MRGMYVLLAVLALTAALAALHRHREGRFRTLRPKPSTTPSVAPSDARPDLRPLLTAHGERATLVQFSSAFCAPCRATRHTLADVARTVPGVTHVEVDAEGHLDLVRRLGIRKTPTTLVLDQHGHEVRRATGAPTRAAVLGALTEAVPS